MISEWPKLAGALTFEERRLVNHICVAGLKETRRLLSKDPKDEQTQGAVLAFETIDDAQFTRCSEFIDQWEKLEQRCANLRNNQTMTGYWKTRGQQLQLEFILERLLAYRVMTQQTVASISARAGLYVGKWIQERETL